MIAIFFLQIKNSMTLAIKIKHVHACTSNIYIYKINWLTGTGSTSTSTKMYLILNKIFGKTHIPFKIFNF